MSASFIRWSGAAAVLGGLIVGVGAFLNEPFPGQYLLGGLLTIAALCGILLVLWREGAGRWGALGILVALAGNLFFAIEQFYALAGVLYGAGLILLAVGAWKTGVFPRWLPALWVLAPLIGLPGVVLTGAADFLSAAATVVFSMAFIAAGYVMWTASAPEPARPSS